jgi:class 3 adenylate cyclase
LVKVSAFEAFDRRRAPALRWARRAAVKKVSLVVLFCDIRGFMRLSVTLGERAPAFVQEFYEKAGAVVVDCGGTILKYIGDAMLCVFPRGRENEAVRCAVLMRDAFAALVERHVPAPVAELGAAVSSGEVTRGLFGHKSLRVDDVMGETVAHAAVLNRLPGIKVTDPVRKALGPEFHAEELPPLSLKWTSENLRAWEVSPRA